MAETWHLLEVNKPIQADVDTQTFGGVVASHNTDLNSRKGAVMARRKETLALPTPNSPHAVAHELVTGRDALNSSDLYAAAYRSSVDQNTPLYSVGVRGFKKIDGSDIADDGANNGWVFPQIVQPSHGETSATIELNGAELRLHAKSPKWYGTPRSIIEAVNDFKYDIGGYEPVLPAGSKFRIDGPFGESNDMAAPNANDFSINHGSSQRLGNSIEFGDIPFWGPIEGRNSDGRLAGQYEYAYFAVSYLYDGYQESPLTLLGQVAELTNSTEASEGCRSIYIELIMRTVRPNEEQRNPPKRARKIRLYCAPAATRLPNPLQSGEFFLASEIDVADWDAKSKALRNSFAVTSIRNGTSYPNISEMGTHNKAFECEVDVGWADQTAGEGRSNAVVYTAFDAGVPVFRLNNNDAYYRCAEVGIFTTADSHENARTIVFFAHTEDETALNTEIANSGNKPTINVGHAFRPMSSDTSLGLVHRTYIGSELTGRPTYTQLSGLNQTEEIVGPPRKYGYSGYDIPVIANVQDKDEIWHPSRMMWACFSPSAVLTPDRFKALNYRDFDAEIMAAVRSGGYLAVLTKRDLTFGIFTGDELQWDFSDVYRNYGCAARKSVSETPFGVMYLGHDGKVKMLSGGSPVLDFNSDPVAELIEEFRDYWPYAVGRYSARHQQYVLTFPRGGGATAINTVIYDFRARGWITADIYGSNEFPSEMRPLAGAEDGDGDIIFAAESNTEQGYIKYAAGDERFNGNCYVHIRTNFGDVLGEKSVQRVRPIYDAGEVPLEMTCTPESEASTHPNDPLFGAQTRDQFTSGLTANDRLALRDRAFTFEIQNFERLGVFAVEVEFGEGVKASV